MIKVKLFKQPSGRCNVPRPVSTSRFVLDHFCNKPAIARVSGLAYGHLATVCANHFDELVSAVRGAQLALRVLADVDSQKGLNGEAEHADGE